MSRRALAAGVCVAVSLAGAGCGSQETEPKGVQPEIVRLVPKDSFQVEAASVAIANQEGLESEGTEFSSENIKREVKRVHHFAQNAGKLSVRYVNNIDNSGDLNLHVSPLLPKKSTHAFVILKDAQAIEALTGTNITAATTLSGDSKVSYLSFLPDDTQTRFDERLSPEGFNRAVETCNSIVDVGLSERSQAVVARQIPEQDLEATTLVIKKINHEAVCNSYALGVTSVDARLSYTDYSKIAGETTLQEKASLGFKIPYLTFPEATFNKLG